MSDIVRESRVLYEIELEAERYRAAPCNAAEQERRAACYPVLVAAVEAIERSTGCGLEVPAYIHDEDAWEVTVGAIRKCAEAMRLVRGIEAEHDQVWRNETQQRLHDQVVADEAVRDEALRRARAEYIQAAAEEGEEDNADTDE